MAPTITAPRDYTTAPLRVAFIGAGSIVDTHLASIKAVGREVRVVALADPSAQAMAARIANHRLEGVQTFADYRRMLESVELDAVNVCTPNGLHAPASIAASEAGCDVIVEKPMAMNAKEARAMIAAAEAAGRKLVIGFQYRFDPRTRLIRRAYDEGVLGDVVFGRVQALRRRGIPNWGVFGRKELQGGGPMIDIGVHALEMCHFSMGAPRPVAASGKTFTYLGHSKSDTVSRWPDWDYQSYTVEDLAVGHVLFDNGQVIHIESSFAAHHQHDGLMDFQLMGTKGGATWFDCHVFTDQLGHMMNMTPGWLPKSDFHANFEAKTRHWIAHLIDDTPNLAPGGHGLMVQQMLDAVYASAANGGREVEIT